MEIATRRALSRRTPRGILLGLIILAATIELTSGRVSLARLRVPAATGTPVCESSAHSLTPFNFGNQPLGTQAVLSKPVLTNGMGRPLNVTSVSTSGDFSGPSGCIGDLEPKQSCSASIVFAPSKLGARSGALTITTDSGVAYCGPLSGFGIGPSITFIAPGSQASFSTAKLNSSGFAPGAPVLVNFQEKLTSGRLGLSFVEPIVGGGSAAMTVVVPPVLNPQSGELVAGNAQVSAKEILPPGPQLSKSSLLKISLPTINDGLPPGVATLAFLQAQEDFSNQLKNDLQGTKLNTIGLVNSLTGEVNALGVVIQAIKNTGANVGSIGGDNVTVGVEQLTAADQRLLATVQALASSPPSPPSTGQVTSIVPDITLPPVSRACLAFEAAAALRDVGNATVFASDIESLLRASEASPACKQANPAIAAAAIVDDSAGQALGILAQAGSTVSDPSVPEEALLYLSVGPGGQLLGIGLSLAQSDDPSRRAVEASLSSFNQAASGLLSSVAQNTQGAVLTNLFTAIADVANQFNQAVPPVSDGTYLGSFNGSQFIDQCSPAGTPSPGSTPVFVEPADGSMAITHVPDGTGVTISLPSATPGAQSGCLLNAQGFVKLEISETAVAVSLPGSGNGVVNPDNSVTFTAAGGVVAGSNDPCTFVGNFSQNPPRGLLLSGTWSCLPVNATSGFKSANGTWTSSLR